MSATTTVNNPLSRAATPPGSGEVGRAAHGPMEPDPSSSGAPDAVSAPWHWSVRPEARVTLAFILWAIAACPLIVALLRQVAVWDIYRVNLLAFVLAWGCAFRSASDQDHVARIRPLFLLGGMTVTAGATLVIGSSLMLASVLVIVGMALILVSLTGQRVRSADHGCLWLLVFAVALPVGVFESLAAYLNDLHAGLMGPLVAAMIGGSATRDQTGIVLEGIHGFTFIRECAGVASLIGLMLFGLYFAVREEVGFTLSLLAVLVAGGLALVLNQVRVVASAVFYVAETPFWSSGLGHEYLGLLLIVLGITVCRGLVPRMIVIETPSVAHQEGGER